MTDLDPPVYIYALGNYCAPVGEGDLLPLKALVLEKTGVNLRRVSRFIQLSLIGAADCVHDFKSRAAVLHDNTAVYLSSEHGDMETVTEVLESMYREGQPPKPLSFINTVSNAACFYVGKTFNLLGESSFISAIGLAFEQALSTAVVDLSLARVPAALVGSVDICTLPLSRHRLRIDADKDAGVGEGSHWLLLGTALAGIKPLAQLICIQHAASLPVLLDCKKSFSGLLMPGQHLSPADRQLVRQRYPQNETCDYSLSLPLYNSQSGYAAAYFLQHSSANEMLHVNKGADGIYCLYQLRRINQD